MCQQCRQQLILNVAHSVPASPDGAIVRAAERSARGAESSAPMRGRTADAAKPDENAAAMSPRKQGLGNGRRGADEMPAGTRRGLLPAFIDPSLALLSDKPPNGPKWVHEIKFDGYRIQARIDAGQVRLLTTACPDWREAVHSSVR
jgi:ATP-dependent DNA ligase